MSDLNSFQTIEQLGLDHAKEAQLIALNFFYKKELALPDGIVFNGATYQCDSDSWDSITKILSTGTLPNNFYWVDSGNNKIAMNFDELTSLAQAMAAKRFEVFNKFQLKKDEVRNAEDAYALLGILNNL